jgi:hypothetical protein
MPRPTANNIEIDLAARIAAACEGAGIELRKKDNRNENVGMTPALAIAKAFLFDVKQDLGTADVPRGPILLAFAGKLWSL